MNRASCLLVGILWLGCDGDSPNDSLTLISDCCPQESKHCASSGCTIECPLNFRASCGTKYCQCEPCEDSCQNGFLARCPTLDKPDSELIDCTTESCEDTPCCGTPCCMIGWLVQLECQ